MSKSKVILSSRTIKLVQRNPAHLLQIFMHTVAIQAVLAHVLEIVVVLCDSCISESHVLRHTVRSIDSGQMGQYKSRALHLYEGLT
jgi:hypothetical protein